MNNLRLSKPLLHFVLTGLLWMTLSNQAQGEPLAVDWEELRKAKRATYYASQVIALPGWNEKKMQLSSCVYKTDDTYKISELVQILIDADLPAYRSASPTRIRGPKELTEEEVWANVALYFTFEDGSEAKFILGLPGHIFYLPKFDGVKFRVNGVQSGWNKKINQWIYSLGTPTVKDPSLVTVEQCEAKKREMMYEGW